jgi:hypothetical protein
MSADGADRSSAVRDLNDGNPPNSDVAEGLMRRFGCSPWAMTGAAHATPTI